MLFKIFLHWSLEKANVVVSDYCGCMVVIQRAIVCYFVWHRRIGLWHAKPPPW